MLHEKGGHSTSPTGEERCRSCQSKSFARQPTLFQSKPLQGMMHLRHLTSECWQLLVGLGIVEGITEASQALSALDESFAGHSQYACHLGRRYSSRRCRLPWSGGWRKTRGDPRQNRISGGSGFPMGGAKEKTRRRPCMPPSTQTPHPPRHLHPLPSQMYSDLQRHPKLRPEVLCQLPSMLCGQGSACMLQG